MLNRCVVLKMLFLGAMMPMDNIKGGCTSLLCAVQCYGGLLRKVFLVLPFLCHLVRYTNGSKSSPLVFRSVFSMFTLVKVQ
jgi:hypothetical protein